MFGKIISYSTFFTAFLGFSWTWNAWAPSLGFYSHVPTTYPPVRLDLPYIYILSTIAFGIIYIGNSHHDEFWSKPKNEVNPNSKVGITQYYTLFWSTPTRFSQHLRTTLHSSSSSILAASGQLNGMNTLRKSWIITSLDDIKHGWILVRPGSPSSYTINDH